MELQTITQPNTLRFQRYLRNQTVRGQSLALAQILLHLRKQPNFKAFDAALIEAINHVRLLGSLSATGPIERITASLENGAADLSEIVSDTHLPKPEVRSTLKAMIESGKVVVRVRRHYLADSGNITPLYFLAENE